MRTTVQLDKVRVANSKLVNSQPLVAVFVGGTAGVGEYTLREFVKAHASHGKGLCIYIVGRNEQAAETIISDCTAICPEAEYQFIKAQDLSLVQDVDKAAAEIIRAQQQKGSTQHIPRIDLLFMSQGGLYLSGREETKEGIARSMSLHYYSRARFILQLLPLLRASTLPARVVSICIAGMEVKLIKEDLSLRQPGNHSFINARSHSVFMNTAFMEKVARENEGKISLVNATPGLVRTPAFTRPNCPTWLKILWYLATPLSMMMAVPSQEAGQRMLYLATDRYPAKSNASSNSNKDLEPVIGTDGEIGSGAYACEYDGEPTSLAKREEAYKDIDREELRQMVWKHTMEAFEAAAAGKVFSG